MNFKNVIEWAKTRPKLVVEIGIFLSLALAIALYIMAQGYESDGLATAGRYLLVFFFLSFLSLIFFDVFKFILRPKSLLRRSFSSLVEKISGR